MELYDSGGTADLNRLMDACVVLLQKNRLTVTTTESCIGGMLSAKLVDIPGVSKVLQENYITYSNKTKRCFSNVSKTTLKKCGTVNIQTAWEIAIGAVFVTSAGITVSTIGIAGPDSGDDEKPVGFVFIGCYVNDRATVEGHRFQGDRIAMRTQAVQSVLRLLRATILENTKA